ncbi:MAG: formylglycine-generating enzyme family protein [Bdellovibrionia bacterium]
MKKLGFSPLIALFYYSLLFFSPFVHSFEGAAVGESTEVTESTVDSAASTSKLDTLEEIFSAFTQGLSPDLSDASQKQAFEVYLSMKFGDPAYGVTGTMLQQIADTKKQYPSLVKAFFRNYHMIVEGPVFPVTPELKSFSRIQFRRVSEVLRDLYHIDITPKLWKKIFQYEDSPLDQTLSKKEARKQASEEWREYLETKISTSFKIKLLDSSIPIKERTYALVRILSAEREVLKSNGKDFGPISRAIIDLIHTLGYQDLQLQVEFKSENGIELIQAFRKVLETREQFALELGFENGFRAVLKDLGVPAPTGLSSESGYLKALDLLEQGVKAAATATATAIAAGTQDADSVKKIRHLSFEESPLRSCLGGDCATRTYLLKALDPNYHYFTLTNGEGVSSGHVTLVVGNAKQNEKSVKMAFIDKIQKIAYADIPAVLEGIRLSVLEQGYILALPDDEGDHNGLANEDSTRHFVKSKILVDKSASQKLVEFVPHDNEYYFPTNYSRAYEELPCSPLRPLADNYPIKLIAAEVNQHWKMAQLNITKLAASALELKSSARLEDRLRYIPTMEAFKLNNLLVDPKYCQTLKTWIEDPCEVFQLRKQVLIHKWLKDEENILELLKNFTFNEQIQIMQNLLDTPRYREALEAEKCKMASILGRFGKNLKLRQALLSFWLDPVLSQWYRPFFDIILAEELDETETTNLIEKIYSIGFNGNDTESLAKISNVVQGTGIEKQVESRLFNYFITHLNSEASLGRVLAKGFASKDRIENKWADYILQPENSSYVDKFQVTRVFKEIREFENSRYGDLTSVTVGDGYSRFTRAAFAWLASDLVAQELKANFLLANVGSGNGLYGLFRSLIPKKELEQIRVRISIHSFLGIFETLLEPFVSQNKTNDFDLFFNRSPLESFEFVPMIFPKEGKTFWMGSPEAEGNRSEDEGFREVTLTRSFEIQKTQVTHLQWNLIMDNGILPKRFMQDGVLGDGREPKVLVNRIQIQNFIDQLNSLQDEYIYRLPTEAEWEFVARAGTQTPYFFGDDSSKLGDYAWFRETSNDLAHPVAKLKPNPFGVFDLYGNVNEMVQDSWSYNPIMIPQIDPQGPSGSNYFCTIRGGNYCSYEWCLRSAYRSYASQELHNDSTGFRLVRTPVAKDLPEQQ